MKYVISLDWFQYFCHASLQMSLEHGQYYYGKVANVERKFPAYKVCAPQEFHSIYRCAVLFCMDGFPIAHVFYRPKSSALDPHSCAVKVANRLLYSSTWSWHLHNLCSALDLEIKSITRVDLCCDFVRFADGEKPSDFIHQYVRGSSSKSNMTYIRKGSNQFCVIGKKLMRDKNGSTAIGEKTEIRSIETGFDYLRFGTRQSGVSVYLYNKSLELQEKHGKPWIRQTWVDNGLMKDSYGWDEKAPDVYRLEISVQAKGMTVKEKDITSENFMDAEVVRKLTVDDFGTQLALESTFWAYQAKYFTFRIAAGQKYRKDMKVLQLFEPEIAPTVKPCYLNRAADSGVAERNAVCTIQRLQRSVNSLSATEHSTLLQAAEILAKIGFSKRYDHLRDFSFALDPEQERDASKQRRAILARLVEQRIGELAACFADPAVADAVERWESGQREIHEAAKVAKRAPDWMRPPHNATEDERERARQRYELQLALEEFTTLSECPF